MMKKYEALLLLHVLCLSSATLQGMNQQQQVQQGPMDYEWFYNVGNVFHVANRYHQEQLWEHAALLYQDYLKEHVGSEYDQNKARLNLAACLMAQRKTTEHWAAFDALLNIADARRLSMEKIVNGGQKSGIFEFVDSSFDDTVNSGALTILNDYIQSGADTDDTKSVLVRTDQVGIGDIFHFFELASHLKDCTGWKVIVSVPNFLLKTLAGAAEGYGFDLVGAKSTQPIVDYETHLVALLGHLNADPTHMNPAKVMFTAPEKAMNIMWDYINPVLENGNTIVVADRGEVGRVATLIGGKQLPRNSENHGRHLDSKPFIKLLKNHSNIVLLDCGGEKDRIAIKDEQKNRYMVMPKEEQPFDMPIALARIMSVRKGIVGFGPDMGQANVFVRCLDSEAQNRMTIIIPNAQEHDMRTSGEGNVYKHMLANCWVVKCKTPADQTQVMEQAYQRMLTY